MAVGWLTRPRVLPRTARPFEQSLPFTAVHTFLLFFPLLTHPPPQPHIKPHLDWQPSDGSGGTSRRLKRVLVRARQHCTSKENHSFWNPSSMERSFIAGVRYNPENHSSQSFSSLKSGSDSDRAQMTPICSPVMEPAGK